MLLVEKSVEKTVENPIHSKYINNDIKGVDFMDSSRKKLAANNISTNCLKLRQTQYLFPKASGQLEFFRGQSEINSELNQILTENNPDWTKISVTSFTHGLNLKVTIAGNHNSYVNYYFCSIHSLLIIKSKFCSSCCGFSSSYYEPNRSWKLNV